MAEFLIYECIITVAVIGLHEAIVALNGREVPPRSFGELGIDYRDVWTWAMLHGIPRPRPWRGVERRHQPKRDLLSDFDTRFIG